MWRRQKERNMYTSTHTHGGRVFVFFSPFFCASSGEVKRMNVLPDGASEVWKRELLKRAGGGRENRDGALELNGRMNS